MLRVDAFTDTPGCDSRSCDFPNRLGGIGAVADGFLRPEPLGVPVSLVAACGALVLLAVAKRGRAIDTGKVLRGAPGRS